MNRPILTLSPDAEKRWKARQAELAEKKRLRVEQRRRDARIRSMQERGNAQADSGRAAPRA